MAKHTEQRSRYFVDWPVQSALLRQLSLYWAWGTSTVALVVLVYRVGPAYLSGQTDILGLGWHYLSPLLVASAVLFPLVMFSALRLSNRFVGPMLRFRRALRQLSEGELPAEIKLRDGDYWTDVASDINRITARFSESDQPASDASSNGRQRITA